MGLLFLETKNRTSCALYLSFFSYALTLTELTILSSFVVLGFVEAIVLAGEQNIKCSRL